MRTATNADMPRSHLDRLTADVTEIERLRAEGRLDRLRLDRARARLDDMRVSVRSVGLRARLDAIAPPTEMRTSRSLPEHRCVLRSIDGEVAVLEAKLVSKPVAGMIERWVERELSALLARVNAKVYGASGDVLLAQIERVIARAKAVGIHVSNPKTREKRERPEFGKGKAWEWEEAFRRVHEEFARARAGTGASSSAPPVDPAAERAALAHELHVDLAAPSAHLKQRIRALAREAHPDLGGDHARMIKVNRLRELVRLP